MALTIEEELFVKEIAAYCKNKFEKYKHQHLANKLLVSKVVNNIGKDIEPILKTINFDFGKFMYFPDKIFTENLQIALRGVCFNKAEQLYYYGKFPINDYYYEPVAHSLKTTNFDYALSECLNSFFDRFFNKIADVTHYRGLRIQGYSEYRNERLKFEKITRVLHELEGVF